MFLIMFIKSEGLLTASFTTVQDSWAGNFFATHSASYVGRPCWRKRSSQTTKRSCVKPEVAFCTWSVIFSTFCKPQKHSFISMRLTEVFTDSLLSVLEEQKFFFPCPSHKKQIMASLIHGHVAMRMRQFCKQRLVQMKNKAQKLCKLAKLAWFGGLYCM